MGEAKHDRICEASALHQMLLAAYWDLLFSNECIEPLALGVDLDGMENSGLLQACKLN